VWQVERAAVRGSSQGPTLAFLDGTGIKKSPPPSLYHMVESWERSTQDRAPIQVSVCVCVHVCACVYRVRLTSHLLDSWERSTQDRAPIQVSVCVCVCMCVSCQVNLPFVGVLGAEHTG